MGYSRRKFLKWLGLTGAGAVLWTTGCTPADEQVAQTETSQSTEPQATSRPTDPAAQEAIESTVAQTTSQSTPQVTPDPTEDAAPPAEAPKNDAPSDEPAYLAVVHGADPAVITEAAVAALGGIARFVRSGNDVIIKPNICVNHQTFEYAATTNPTVVGTLVRLCLDAGAKRVRVMDTPYTGDPETAYRTSGIWDAVVAAGGQMEVMSKVKFGDFDIPNGRDIKSWSIYRDVVEADVLINVPIAKHHGSTRLTLGAKNLMGVIGRPNQFHRNLDQRITDLSTLLRPALTVVDAVRILTDHGPGGGNLDDVEKTDTVIASHDMVVADAYATTLFGLSPDDIGYIRLGAEMGLGVKDWTGVSVVEETL
jgi:uncharacterized protein (DUF362 family)